MVLKFNKDLYPKVALIKAAYAFTDRAYLHLDADTDYFYVHIQPKDGMGPVLATEFENEMLTQSVRHSVYEQTKNIREIMIARAMATSVTLPTESSEPAQLEEQSVFLESDILKDWFEQ